MLNICLLGCGGGMPMPFRNLSSTLFEYKGRKILLDCGEGTQVSIRMISWGFKSIDVIVISHTHGDHIVGLPGLLSTIGNSGRVDDLTIIGPKGIKEVVENLLIIAKYLPYKINILENEEEINLKIEKLQTLKNRSEKLRIKDDLMQKTVSISESSFKNIERKGVVIKKEINKFEELYIIPCDYSIEKGVEFRKDLSEFNEEQFL